MTTGKKIDLDHCHLAVSPKANGGILMCQDSHKRPLQEGSQIKPMLCIPRTGRCTAKPEAPLVPCGMRLFSVRCRVALGKAR